MSEERDNREEMGEPQRGMSSEEQAIYNLGLLGELMNPETPPERKAEVAQEIKAIAEDYLTEDH